MPKKLTLLERIDSLDANVTKISKLVSNNTALIQELTNHLETVMKSVTLIIDAGEGISNKFINHDKRLDKLEAKQ